MGLRRAAAAFIAIAFVAVGGGCATSPGAAGPPSSYIAGASLDAAAFIGPAPDPAGDAQKADLAAVKAAQALKGQPRWVIAQGDDAIAPYPAFGSVLGPKFTKAATPRLAALFDVLFSDVRRLTAPAKDRFARPRPPLVDASLQTCMPLEQTKSYPSGHATRGWLMALVLSEMIPEKANDILARGRDYGDSRVVCAEHFPTDVQAGRLIGAAVFAAARSDPAFARDYEAARREVRAALALPR
jgi:acid phosphatase (class A)